jgi:DNA-binding MarR family transcriptional regulator
MVVKMEMQLDDIDISLERDAAELEALNLRLNWVSRSWLQRDLVAYNMTVPQYMTLRCIQDSQEGCSMSKLAESSHQLTATMTGIVDRLVERGLVERTRHPSDRRALVILLTPAGLKLMETINAAKRSLIMRVLSSLSMLERQAMLNTTHRYLEVMENTVCSA